MLRSKPSTTSVVAEVLPDGPPGPVSTPAGDVEDPHVSSLPSSFNRFAMLSWTPDTVKVQGVFIVQINACEAYGPTTANDVRYVTLPPEFVAVNVYVA